MIYTSMEQMIGGTPLLRLKAVEEKYGLAARLYGKMEFLNATGSIKDRVARQMILDAEEDGRLQKDSVIIEPTSGNTGIGLAAVGAARGYRVIIVMPDTMSVASRKLIFIPAQFDNPSNPKAHYLTTGPEICEDLDGKVDILVAGAGTGGTLSGTGRYLKEKNPGVRIIAVEPDTSAVLSGEKAGPHGLQGIGAGFIPSVLDTSVIDEIIRVTDSQAYVCGGEFGKLQGVLVGISAGAALHAAVQTALKEENKGKNIVVILPDSGDRYLSTKLFGE